MNIIVIGKSGQLAQELKLLDSNITCLGRDEVDITDYAKLTATLDRYQVGAMINASAYTAVDKAESEPEQAYGLNAKAVENLASYASSKGIHFVHISSDYVFAGDKGSPYLVNEPLSPIGVYGASKAAGEQAIRANNPDNSCIIRTSWVYSIFGNNFVKTMLRLMREKSELAVIDDQIGSPTSASELARACLFASQNKVQGIHHFTDAGACSWYDFALSIQELAKKYKLLDRVIPVRPIPSSAYPTAAKRPNYSVLDKSTLKTSFDGFQPKHWRQALEMVVAHLAHQSPNE